MDRPDLAKCGIEGVTRWRSRKGKSEQSSEVQHCEWRGYFWHFGVAGTVNLFYVLSANVGRTGRWRLLFHTNRIYLTYVLTIRKKKILRQNESDTLVDAMGNFFSGAVDAMYIASTTRTLEEDCYVG